MESDFQYKMYGMSIRKVVVKMSIGNQIKMCWLRFQYKMYGNVLIRRRR